MDRAFSVNFQPTETNCNIFALTCSWIHAHVLPSSRGLLSNYISYISRCKHNSIHVKSINFEVHNPPSAPTDAEHLQQRSSMHRQDVSRKLLSHNGATAKGATFVQIKIYLSCARCGWRWVGFGCLTWWETDWRWGCDRKFINVCSVCCPHPRRTPCFSRACNCLQLWEALQSEISRMSANEETRWGSVGGRAYLRAGDSAKTTQKEAKQLRFLPLLLHFFLAKRKLWFFLPFAFTLQFLFKTANLM